MSQETNKPSGDLKPGLTPEIKKQDAVKTGASDTTTPPVAANKDVPISKAV
jgi:hypothetical protein